RLAPSEQTPSQPKAVAAELTPPGHVGRVATDEPIEDVDGRAELPDGGRRRALGVEEITDVVVGRGERELPVGIVRIPPHEILLQGELRLVMLQRLEDSSQAPQHDTDGVVTRRDGAAQAVVVGMGCEQALLDPQAFLEFSEGPVEIAALLQY